MEDNWSVYAKKSDFKKIASDNNIDQVVARIIINRDISEQEIKDYLNPGLDKLIDGFLLFDMRSACEIINEKILKKKKIRIISDYDVDGVMSNYILYRGIQDLGADISYEIPNRVTDGYGVNMRMIIDAIKDKIDTIITCDNGISAFEPINYAVENGLTVIVTDHHQVPFIENNFVKQEKLVNANRRSRIDTLFQSPQIIDERKISGKTRLSGYVDRYNSLKPYCKEAIIILSSEGKIAFNNHKIVLIKKIDYKDFEGAIKDWIKCAFYLGVVFSKTTEDHLSFFLGVDTK